MPQNQNHYLKRKKWIAAIVGALSRDTTLPMAFTRYDGRGFIGAQDDTVTWKLPGMTKAREYEWRTRTNPIVLDMITRTSVSIKLDTHVVSAVPITDEENTLDLTSYAEEVLLPQKEAVVEFLEGRTKAALANIPFAGNPIDAAEADDPYKWALAVNAKLNKQGTPRTNRRLLVGSNAFGWLAQSDQLRQYDPGQARTAFRQATLGTIANLEIVDGSLALGENDIYAVHPSAMVIANLAPVVAQGAVWGVRANHNGWSMRLQRSFDANWERDRSVLSSFAGWSSVNDEYQRETDGSVSLDGEGFPILTQKNARGAKGTFTPTV